MVGNESHATHCRRLLPRTTIFLNMYMGRASRTRTIQHDGMVYRHAKHTRAYGGVDNAERGEHHGKRRLRLCLRDEGGRRGTRHSHRTICRTGHGDGDAEKTL